MSRALDILAALKALVIAAVPTAYVTGFTEDASPLDRIPEAGAIRGDFGDPGEPEVEFSPLTYIYSHRIPVEFCVPVLTNLDPVADSDIAAQLAPIGTAVAADRQLGGLCDFLQVTAPEYSSQDTSALDGVPPFRSAAFNFIAEYSVSDPLGS